MATIVEEEWFALDLESKLNKKIDALQSLVHEQSVLIHTLSSEIKTLKGELLLQHHPSTCQHLSSQNDRVQELLEELKVIKQREINIMIREKKPIPFYSSQCYPIPTPFNFKKDPPNDVTL
uniref:Uncharacterized protein n=1 Tax=viral metagenome TaxID=1070528 RepID=A0A6C0KTT9_9ZZZZ